MKKTFIPLLVLALFATGSASAQKYYWAHGQKVPVSPDSSRLVVETLSGTAAKTVDAFLRSQSLTGKVYAGKTANQFLVDVTVQGQKDASRTKPTPVAGVSAKYYSLRLSNGQVITPDGEILLAPKPGISYAEAVQSVKNDLLFVSQSRYGTFTVRPKDPAQLLDLANRIYEGGKVAWAQPDFFTPRQFYQAAVTPNDPLYPQQYYLNNTGQTGGRTDVDINAPEAWGITTGIHPVRVAVIDEGVEPHTDLAGHLVAGFDPRLGTGGAPQGTNSHGMACAGIIAAQQNNSTGMAGIANCAQIVPVNISAAGGMFYTDGEIAAAINWAWDPTQGNADVLSNSWGGGAYSDAIATAFANARSQGRGGRGAVVVAASGNDYASSVSFPANLPGVIAVGAVDKSGTMLSYSNSGPQLSLVAPSGPVNGDVVTLARNNGYTSTFNGTSAACPQVAGVAALVLSVSTALTGAQVKDLLTSTASYMGSSFSNSYGYGRLNAKAALQRLTVNGPNAVCGASQAYSIGAQPPGTTISWSASPASLFATTSATNTLTFAPGMALGASGTGTISVSITGACNSATFTKAISVGKPLVPRFTYSNSLSMCYGKAPTGNFQVTTPQPGMSYSCDFINNATGAVEATKGGTLFYFNSAELEPGTFTLVMTASNGCDITTARLKMTITDCGGGGMVRAAFPNPAKDHLTVAIPFADGSETREAISLTEPTVPRSEATSIVLYDNHGTPQYRGSTSAASHRVDTSRLPAGVYYLILKNGNQLSRETVVIEH